MGCSIYQLVVKNGCYGFEFDISDPLYSVRHAPSILNYLLNITSQLGNGDKIIVIYKKDVIKAMAFSKDKYESTEWNYPYHEKDLQSILKTMKNKDMEFYYVDGV